MGTFTYLGLILSVFFGAAIVYGMIILSDIAHILESNKNVD